MADGAKAKLFNMSSGGRSILTGSLLLSVLMSSVMRMAPDSARGARVRMDTSSQSSALGHRIGQKFSRPNPKQSEVENEANADYLRTFNDYIDEECADDEQCKRNKCENKERDNAKACKFDPSDFMVALLPDPVHTHLALMFDRTIEAIEEALQDEHYMLSAR